jgi:hypothetical protein
VHGVQLKSVAVSERAQERDRRGGGGACGRVAQQIDTGIIHVNDATVHDEPLMGACVNVRVLSRRNPGKATNENLTSFGEAWDAT